MGRVIRLSPESPASLLHPIPAKCNSAPGACVPGRCWHILPLVLCSWKMLAYAEGGGLADVRAPSMWLWGHHHLFWGRVSAIQLFGSHLYSCK